MSDFTSEIDELAKQNIQQWLSAEHARERLAKGKVDENIGPYITITARL